MEVLNSPYPVIYLETTGNFVTELPGRTPREILANCFLCRRCQPNFTQDIFQRWHLVPNGKDSCNLPSTCLNLRYGEVLISS